jgi:hypothetical protein
LNEYFSDTFITAGYTPETNILRLEITVGSIYGHSLDCDLKDLAEHDMDITGDGSVPAWSEFHQWLGTELQKRKVTS